MGAFVDALSSAFLCKHIFKYKTFWETQEDKPTRNCTDLLSMIHFRILIYLQVIEYIMSNLLLEFQICLHKILLNIKNIMRKNLTFGTMLVII